MICSIKGAHWNVSDGAHSREIAWISTAPRRSRPGSGTTGWVARIITRLTVRQRDPDTILTEVARTLDFSRPVGLMLLGVVNHILDSDEAISVVNRLVAALPSGSYLALTHSTAEIHGEPMLEVMRQVTERGGTPIRARTRQELLQFFDGMEMLDPGVVSCSLWRPDPIEVGTPAEVYLFGGVGRIR